MVLLFTAALAAPPEEFAGCDNTNKKWVTAHNESVQAFEADQLEHGVKAARRAVELQPKCHASLIVFGEGLFRLGEVEALGVAKAGAALYPEAPPYPLLASRVLFSAQEFKPALEWAERASALAPLNRFALEHHIVVLLRLGRYEDAAALLDISGLPAVDLACVRSYVYADQDRFAEADAALTTCAGSQDANLVARARLFRAGTAGDLDRVGEQATALGAVNTSEMAKGVAAIRAKDYATAEAIFAALLAKEDWNTAYRASYAASLLGQRKMVVARKELDQLFDAGTWVTIERNGGVTGITTKGAEEALEENLQSALAMLVEVLIQQQSYADAAVALRKTEARFGRTPLLLSLEVDLALAQGGAGSAWGIAAPAARSWPDDERVLHAASRVAFKEPARLEADVVEILLAHGGEATVHNTVAALANGDNPECARATRTALPRMSDSERDWARGVAYDCALGQGRLDEADAVRATGTGGLSAEKQGYHARLVFEAGRVDDAVVIAKTLVTDTQGEHNAIVVLASAAKAKGDLAGELALARRPEAPTSVRINTAIDHYNAGSYTIAQELMGRVECREVGDAARCEELRTTVNEAR